MKAISFILVCIEVLTVNVWGEDFISEFEYGQMLYQNPRGVSCAPCHGDHGEGALISSYKIGDKIVKLKGPDIRNIDRESLRQALSKGKGVMPPYFMTNREIQVLYTYIHRQAKMTTEK